MEEVEDAEEELEAAEGVEKTGFSGDVFFEEVVCEGAVIFYAGSCWILLDFSTIVTFL